MEGCTFHRVYSPNLYVDHDIKYTTSLTDDLLEWCEVLMYNRISLISPDFLRRKAKELNFKIWVDNDDAIDLPKDHPNYSLFSKTKAGLTIRAHLINADAVITTQDRLADRMRQFNDNVHVLPNTLPYGEGQFVKRERIRSDKIRLVYAATPMNYRNVDMMAGVMKRLEGIEVVIVGFTDDKFYKHIVKYLTDDGKIPYSTFPWTQDINRYMDGYVGDVMILPSRQTEFNSMKSNLKILESGAMGMPIIVSENDPYLGWDNSGVNYVNTTKHWIDSIMKYVDSPELVCKDGEELFTHCNKYFNSKNSIRSDRYKEI